MAKYKSVTQLSTNLNNSGSGIAAIRLHNALKDSKEYKSYFFTEFMRKKVFYKNLIYENQFRTFYRKIISKSYKKLIPNFSFLNSNLESYSILPIVPKINLNYKLNTDIYNIHWVQHEFINIFDMYKLPKNRIVWTMHDCWPIEGTEHYPLQKIRPYFYQKIQKFMKEQKKELIKRKNIHLVAPSNWIKKQALNSFDDFEPKVITIPNAIPNIFFEEYSKFKARKNLNLPQDKILILFSSYGGERDLRKGMKFIRQLLNFKENEISNLEFITIGSFKELNKYNKEKLSTLGKIKGDLKLREVYKAIDIVIVPSLIDNLPQVATEAQACGRPVIGFDTGGMKDIVINDKTGCLSINKDCISLQKNINRVIEKNLLNESKANQISKRAFKLWNNNVIKNSYTELYNKILEK